jgi:adenosine deaminase
MNTHPSLIDPAFPLCELHRHLDGSVRLSTILELGQQYHLPLPAATLEGLRPFVQVSEPQPGVMAFMRKFKWQTIVMVNLDACRRIACENVLDAAAEGLDYIELRFSPMFMAETHQLDPEAVTAAVIEGFEEGRRQTGIRANLVGIISRTYGVEKGWQELKALLAHKHAITALDLAGDEANYPGEGFVEHFRAARDAGWHITVHAGEADGPHSIWQALQGLGAERIGHCLSAVSDPELMDHLKKERIGIECSLSSNVQTSTVAGYAEHPIRTFLEHGLQPSLSTDDPGISAITIADEYNLAAPKAGLTPEMIHHLQYNALEAAFISTSEKKELIRRKQASREEKTWQP